MPDSGSAGQVAIMASEVAVPGCGEVPVIRAGVAVLATEPHGAAMLAEHQGLFSYSMFGPLFIRSIYNNFIMGEMLHIDDRSMAENGANSFDKTFSLRSVQATPGQDNSVH